MGNIIKHLKTSQKDNGTSLLQELYQAFLRFQKYLYLYLNTLVQNIRVK